MIDKEWLERIDTAYKAYPYPSFAVEKFIAWLYSQYGIVQPKEEDK